MAANLGWRTLPDWVLPTAPQPAPGKKQASKQKSIDPFNGRTRYANSKKTMPALHLLEGVSTKKNYCLACWFKTAGFFKWAYGHATLNKPKCSLASLSHWHDFH